MPDRNARYEVIGPMIEKGKINRLHDIFNYISMTRLAKDIGVKAERLSDMFDNPENFRFKTILKIGDVCEISEYEVARLTVAEIIEHRTKADGADRS